MKDSTFIELLNLYVDGELSQADASLLAQEIAINPERKNVYLQYCRIARAGEILAEQYRADRVPQGSVFASATLCVERKISKPAGRPGLFVGWAVGAGMAFAVACVAVMVLRQETALEPKTLASSQAQMESIAIGNQDFPKEMSRRGLKLATQTQEGERPYVLVGDQLFAIGNPKEDFADFQTVKPLSQDWMSQVQLSEMPIMREDTLVIQRDVATGLLVRKLQSQEGQRTEATLVPVEMTAFQFRR